MGSFRVNAEFADAGCSERALSSAVPHHIKTLHWFSEGRLTVAFVGYEACCRAKHACNYVAEPTVRFHSMQADQHQIPVQAYNHL